MPFSFRARYVFPVDAPPIEGGVVMISDHQITEVGTASNTSETIDLGDVALLPGLVNCHTHLEFSDRVRPLGSPGMSLVDWIRLIIAERARGDRAADAAFSAGIRESLSNGVTTIGDITTGVALPQAPLLDITLFNEVIGFSRARADSALAAAAERLDTLARQSQARIGISPHAPYTVSPQLLAQVVALARDRNLPVAMHVAESIEELQFLATGDGAFQELLYERSMWDPGAISRGSRPLDYLRMLADAPRALVIHGNHLDDVELHFLATNRERMSLVYCPRTHAYFQHSPYPLEKALVTGVHVALGTDSRASNPDLSLLREMQFVAQQYPAMVPHDILRLGTLAGAEARGCDSTVGSLTPGKLANMIALPLSSSATTPTEALEEILTTDGITPTTVWLRGEDTKLIRS
jgi:cytosine/adenosine deaminase-related metal-dependent hydrolase